MRGSQVHQRSAAELAERQILVGFLHDRVAERGFPVQRAFQVLAQMLHARIAIRRMLAQRGLHQGVDVRVQNLGK